MNQELFCLLLTLTLFHLHLKANVSLCVFVVSVCVCECACLATSDPPPPTRELRVMASTRALKTLTGSRSSVVPLSTMALSMLY